MQLSVMNAAVAMGVPRERVQESALSDNGSICFAKTFRAMSRWVDEHLFEISLNKIRQTDGSAVRNQDFRVRGVLSLPEGVYLVRLIGLNGNEGEADHIVVVNTTVMRVIDSFEPNDMTLSTESLHCCVGDGFEL